MSCNVWLLYDQSLLIFWWKIKGPSTAVSWPFIIMANNVFLKCRENHNFSRHFANRQTGKGHILMPVGINDLWKRSLLHLGKENMIPFRVRLFDKTSLTLITAFALPRKEKVFTSYRTLSPHGLRWLRHRSVAADGARTWTRVCPPEPIALQDAHNAAVRRRSCSVSPHCLCRSSAGTSSSWPFAL